MARTITEIKAEMTANYIADPAIQVKYSIDPSKTFEEQFSKVSVESIIFYVFAAGVWVVEKLHDTTKVEVAQIADTVRSSTTKYEDLAKAFQYGFNLISGTANFDNTGKTDAEIQASKIITYAAVVEQDKLLVIKVAKTVGSDLAKLTANELSAFNEYMARVKDAGVFISVVSDDPEQLQLELVIYFNPLVLKSDGSRVDGTSATPVADAVKLYPRTISFDGTLVLASLVDKLQKIDGVVIPHVAYAAYKYALVNWVPFDVLHRPTSGYIRIADQDLTITYEPRSAQ